MSLTWICVADAESVITAVEKHGSHVWYQIGLELGFADSEVRATVDQITAKTGKLRALIEKRRARVGTEAVARELLDVCMSISTPIAGAVHDELMKRLGEFNRHHAHD